MERHIPLFKDLLQHFPEFTCQGAGLRLRSYQEEVARAVIEALLARQGDTIVVAFPRQSGKNELQAQLESYLLLLYSGMDAEIIKVSPTWKPQTLNAMHRLERALGRNLLTHLGWEKEAGYIYRLGRARVTFLSGSPTTNVVGATANLLLECDEAQDISPEKWDKDFAPMAASTNANCLFWGTMWTSQTLLARELRQARQAEAQDGRRRTFVIDADVVAREVPVYGHFVQEQVERLGRNHPLVKSQYFSEEVDNESGMFPSQRLALLQGEHPVESRPASGGVYAFLLDVGGEAREGETAATAGSHDATALTIVRIDFSAMSDPLVAAPIYRSVNRFQWSGARHSDLYGQLRSLLETWQPRRLVVDATGVGAGLASFLEKAWPGRVTPFIFSAASKSELGWKFLSLVETGRYREYQAASQGGHAAELQQLFYRQARFCQMELVAGAEQRLRWGVPPTTLDPQTSAPLHDDLLVSAALCAELDEQTWGVAESVVLAGNDPLRGLSEVY